MKYRRNFTELLMYEMRQSINYFFLFFFEVGLNDQLAGWDYTSQVGLWHVQEKLIPARWRSKLVVCSFGCWNQITNMQEPLVLHERRRHCQVSPLKQSSTVQYLQKLWPLRTCIWSVIDLHISCITYLNWNVCCNSHRRMQLQVMK